MATLKEYFDTDFSNTCILSHIGTYGKIDEVNIEIISRVHIDFTSNTKYLSYYIPENNDGIDIVLAILSNIDETISV